MIFPCRFKLEYAQKSPIHLPSYSLVFYHISKCNSSMCYLIFHSGYIFSIFQLKPSCSVGVCMNSGLNMHWQQWWKATAAAMLSDQSHHSLATAAAACPVAAAVCRQPRGSCATAAACRPKLLIKYTYSTHATSQNNTP